MTACYTYGEGVGKERDGERGHLLWIRSKTTVLTLILYLAHELPPVWVRSAIYLRVDVFVRRLSLLKPTNPSMGRAQWV